MTDPWIALAGIVMGLVGLTVMVIGLCIIIEVVGKVTDWIKKRFK